MTVQAEVRCTGNAGESSLRVIRFSFPEMVDFRQQKLQMALKLVGI
jgi:hypothetical protein